MFKTLRRPFIPAGQKYSMSYDNPQNVGYNTPYNKQPTRVWNTRHFKKTHQENDPIIVK